MNLEDVVRSAGTGEVGLRFVDDGGRAIAEFPVGDSASGDGPTAELEILRGALARILVESCGDMVEFRYGTRIESVIQDDAGVTVSFADGSERRFDLLIVAEGIRSTTRNEVFGGEPDYRDLGYYTSYCTIPRIADDDQWWRWYSTTGGRSVQLRPDNVRHDSRMPQLPLAANGSRHSGSRDPGTRAAGTSTLASPTLHPACSPSWPRTRTASTSTESRRCECPPGRGGRVAVVGDAAYCATPRERHGHQPRPHRRVPPRRGDRRPRRSRSCVRRLRGQDASPSSTKLRSCRQGCRRSPIRLAGSGVRILRLVVRLAASAPVRALMARVTSSSDAAAPTLPDYDVG